MKVSAGSDGRRLVADWTKASLTSLTSRAAAGRSRRPADASNHELRLVQIHDRVAWGVAASGAAALSGLMRPPRISFTAERTRCRR